MVGIVSELTGYPPDLLDLDLDLEADLGVDTVKQAEVFAAVRERFGVARDDALAARLPDADPRRSAGSATRHRRRPQAQKRESTPPLRHPTQWRCTRHGHRRPRRHRPDARAGCRCPCCGRR